MPTIYVDVPIREDLLPDVFRLLANAPLRGSIEPLHVPDAAQLDDDSDEDAGRDDARWDAFWSKRENVTEHLVERSDLTHAILRALAEYADGGDWVVTEDIATDIGE